MPDNQDTRAEELPPDETGPVPVNVVRAETRWYGLTTEAAVLAVGSAAVGVGVVLLVFGSIVPGAVVLALGALVLVLLVRGPVSAAVAGPAARGRAALATKLSAGQRLAVLRRELDMLARRRDDRLRALGDAVYRGDDAAVEPLRAQLADLDRRRDELGEEVERTLLEARERLSAVELETAKTQAVSMPLESRDDDRQ